MAAAGPCNNEELATLYAQAASRPTGCCAFDEEDGRVVVHPGEIFCRVVEGGSLCANTHKYENSNAVRLHIKNDHPTVPVARGKSGRVSFAIKNAARDDFAKAMTAARGFVVKAIAIANEAQFAGTPDKGKTSASKAKRRAQMNANLNAQAAAVEKAKAQLFVTPSRKGKNGQKCVNQSEMRRMAGYKDGKGKCSSCTEKKNKCPDLTQASYQVAGGCQLLALFEEAEPESDDDLLDEET